eukprot:9529750-Alexandrium_andersonii.AAC.1
MALSFFRISPGAHLGPPSHIAAAARENSPASTKACARWTCLAWNSGAPCAMERDVASVHK